MYRAPRAQSPRFSISTFPHHLSYCTLEPSTKHQLLHLLSINPGYLPKSWADPCSLLCSLIFCTLEAVVVYSYKAVWEIHTTLFKMWKSISTRFFSTHIELNNLCSFQGKKPKNLSLDHLIPLSALIVQTYTPKTGLTLFLSILACENYKYHRRLNLCKFSVIHLDRTVVFRVFFAKLECSIQTYILNKLHKNNLPSLFKQTEMRGGKKVGLLSFSTNFDQSSISIFNF